MFQDALPRDTQARTRRRLERHGPTHGVLFVNALEWVSLSLHLRLGRILLATLGIALASRYGLVAMHYLMLAPLAWWLVLEPVLQAGSAMHRQLELHHKATRIWAKPDSELAEKPEN